MQQFFDNVVAIVFAVLLHLAIAALLFLGLSLQKPPRIIAANVIQATIVDPDSVQAGTHDVQELPPEAEPEVLPEPDEPDEPEPEPLPDPEELERERLAEVERQEEAQRLEQERQEKERQEAERVEQQRIAEREEQARKRREAEAEAERKAKAEAARQAKARAEAERKRKEEAERKKREREAAAQRARDAQEARKREEAERALQDMLAAEDRARDARAAGLEDLYKLKIKQKIQRYWNPPPLSGAVSCELRVRQLRTGDLHSIERVDCNGNAPLERSLQAAVERASPFPRPDDPSLFDPLLIFKFDTDD